MSVLPCIAIVMSACAYVLCVVAVRHSIATREMVRRLDAVLLDFIEPGHRR